MFLSQQSRSAGKSVIEMSDQQNGAGSEGRTVKPRSRVKPKPPPRRSVPVVHPDGTHSFKISGTSFRVAQRYTPLGIVGKGSYGVVCAAQNSWNKERVAIKKISPMCEDQWDAKHTLRELRIMRLMEHHPNVISLRDLSVVPEADELYIVMELMDSDLHKIIVSKQALSHAHCQVLMMQILRGVKAMHANNVLHRDLKPGNILVGRDCQVRITDFGLARAIAPDEMVGTNKDDGNPNSGNDGDDGATGPASAMTEYVVTRWYRCPELLLAPHVAYTTAVDLWAVGCIFAEMVLREPLFPGRSYVHQVQLILDAIGTPPSEEEMGFKPRSDASAYLSRQQAKPGKPWPKILPKATPVITDLISRLLVFNPQKRWDADEAMQHEYFMNCPDLPCDQEKKTPHGQNLAPPPVDVDFSFDRDDVELAELRSFIKAEVSVMQTQNRLQELERGEAAKVKAENAVRARIAAQKQPAGGDSDTNNVTDANSPANTNSTAETDSGNPTPSTSPVRVPISKSLVKSESFRKVTDQLTSPVGVPGLVRKTSAGSMKDLKGTGGMTLTESPGKVVSRVRGKLEKAIMDSR